MLQGRDMGSDLPPGVVVFGAGRMLKRHEAELLITRLPTGGSFALGRHVLAWNRSLLQS